MALFLCVSVLAAPAAAQTAPALTIDEEVSTFAFAPDGRIAYAVRHVFSQKKLQMQRDDIWVATLEGKKTRIIEGKKLFLGPPPFSYAVQSLRWSPDGARLAVEMYTSTMVEEPGERKEGYATWLLDASGKELHVAQGSALVEDAGNSAWLADGVTLAFLHAAAPPQQLFDIRTVRPASGQAEILFAPLTFSAVAWSLRPAGGSVAVAIEQTEGLGGAMRLVWLDLLKKERRELAQLASYAGQLSLSPSGKLVAYFRDAETLEVREVAHPDRVGRVRVGLGVFEWAADEQRVLIKRGTFETSARGSGRRSGSLDWLALPPLETSSASAARKNLPDAQLQPALSGLLFQSFAVSPDGRWIGVTAPGSRPLQIFPVH